MTQKASIALALLKGEILSIRDGFDRFACTNLPREISRSIEKDFGVLISKTPTKFISRDNQSGHYYTYRLPKTQYNALGIKKMLKYVKDNAK